MEALRTEVRLIVSDAMVARAREAAKATGQFYAMDHTWDVVIRAALTAALQAERSEGGS